MSAIKQPFHPLLLPSFIILLIIFSFFGSAQRKTIYCEPRGYDVITGKFLPPDPNLCIGTDPEGTHPFPTPDKNFGGGEESAIQAEVMISEPVEDIFYNTEKFIQRMDYVGQRSTQIHESLRKKYFQILEEEVLTVDQFNQAGFQKLEIFLSDSSKNSILN